MSTSSGTLPIYPSVLATTSQHYGQPYLHIPNAPPLLHPIPGVYATSTPIGCTEKTIRRRRSAIPPEQREQTRRLKKQNMERRRRACISDKMNALHTLAMQIVGVEPRAQQKVEKADILNTCFKVIEGIAEIANEQPDIKARLQKIRHRLPKLREPSIPNDPPTNENTRSSWYSEDLSIDSLHSDCERDATTSKHPSPVPHCRTMTRNLHDNENMECSSLFSAAGPCDSGVHSMDRSRVSEVRIPTLHTPFRSPAESLQSLPTYSHCSDRPGPLKPRHRFPLADCSNIPPKPVGKAQNNRLEASTKSAFKHVTSASNTLWRPYL